MAFMNQTIKAELTPGIKAVLTKYSLKGTIRTSRYAITVTITEGPLDFIDDTAAVLQGPQNRFHPFKDQIVANLRRDGYMDVNEYHISSNHTGRCRAALLELRDAMNDGNWDNSDIQTDYFDVGWYSHIHIGKWNKPYKLIGNARKAA
jgi:hypothetical protein